MVLLNVVCDQWPKYVETQYKPVLIIVLSVDLEVKNDEPWQNGRHHLAYANSN